MIFLKNMTVWHKRHQPKKHQFHYPYLLAKLKITISGIEELKKRSLLAINHFSILSIHEHDYLNKKSTPLFFQLLELIEQKSWRHQVSYFDWITSPKLLGLGFNPVSFYFARSAQDEVLGVVVEVNNTFKERHIYLLDSLEAINQKEFHVSPFNNRQGEYHFSFTHPAAEKLNLRVELHRDGNLVFAAGVIGQWESKDRKSEALCLLRSKLSPWMTLWWIHIQAFILFFIRRLPFYKKPRAEDRHTIITNNE